MTGAVLAANNANQPRYVLGTGTEYRTAQDHFKARLGWDITTDIRVSYLLGVWQNKSDNTPVSYLRNAAGQPVYVGMVNINGQSFPALTGGDFAATKKRLTHVMHGLTVKSHTQKAWDWELDASLYDYRRDDKRQNAASITLPNALADGAGMLAVGRGTGWNNRAAKGTWRPGGIAGGHIVDSGLQQASYRLQYLSSTIAGHWLADGEGSTAFSAANALNYPSHNERYLSPKAALSHQATPDLVVKGSTGRAECMPTVATASGQTGWSSPSTAPTCSPRVSTSAPA